MTNSWSGCQKDVQDVCHDLADSFRHEIAHMLDQRRETIKLKTWERRSVFTENGMEIHGGPKHAAIALKKTGKGAVSSAHGADTELLDMLANDPPVMHAAQ